MNINILGTEYEITVDYPSGSNSICDYMNKEIHITKGLCEAEYWATIRHELVHAFMFESGLGFNFEHTEKGQEELIVDWFAIQYPKIKETIEYLEKTLAFTTEKGESI